MLLRALLALLAACHAALAFVHTPQQPLVPSSKSRQAQTGRSRRGSSRRPSYMRLDLFPHIPIGAVSEAARAMASASGVSVGLSDTEHLNAGFLGGSVGVIGTLLALEFKKYRVKQDSECCYCRGSGHIACGQCLGTGELTLLNTVNGKSVSLGCPVCSGMTYITCINCKGDGRNIPVFLNRKASRDPEDELEEIGMG